MKKINLTAIITMALLAGLLASCKDKNVDKNVPEKSMEQTDTASIGTMQSDTVISEEEGPRGISADSTQASPPVIAKP